MTPDHLLLTLVHISDLHIGVPDLREGASDPDALVKTWWGRSRHFHGLLGHTFRAMRQLEEFFLDLAEIEPTRLVVTGDLTTCGADAEFELARKYLTSEAAFRDRACGLREERALAMTVPGNHDHWPGNRCIFGPRPAAISRLFPLRPLEPQILPLDDRHRVVVLGINTDEDVVGGGSARFFGRARCVSQLEALDRQLSEIEDRIGDIRVLLLHHSRMHKEFVLGTTPDTEEQLDRFVKQARISILLSGHLHIPKFNTERIGARHGAWDLLEARCGSTLQRDVVPDAWKKKGFASLTAEPNNLLVHRIVKTVDGAVEWRVTSHVRTDRGFLALPAVSVPPVVVCPRPDRPTA
jgi:hypothetical protein